jgi:hypothetical protein
MAPSASIKPSAAGIDQVVFISVLNVLLFRESE